MQCEIGSLACLLVVIRGGPLSVIQALFNAMKRDLGRSEHLGCESHKRDGETRMSQIVELIVERLGYSLFLAHPQTPSGSIYIGE